jgi:hypothetical protein
MIQELNSSMKLAYEHTDYNSDYPGDEARDHYIDMTFTHYLSEEGKDGASVNFNA